MSNSVLEGIIKDKDYNFKKLLFKIVKDFNLSINELLLLVYFLNQDKPTLDVNNISEVTYLDEKEILASFTSLTNKGLLSIKINKGNNGIISEVIDISNVYKAMISDINVDVKKKNESTIFSVFEKEFGRSLSPMEFEIINAWLKSGMNEDLIIGALKEATYNGVSNLRYIDKIIYEWGKKGFKNMDDVNNYLKKKNSQKDTSEEKVLFDYNWLDDEE
jgi:DNA replication protein